MYVLHVCLNRTGKEKALGILELEALGVRKPTSQSKPVG